MSLSKWIKASRSGNVNACVELARDGSMILLRDSKNPAAHHRYSLEEIRAFFDGVRKGEFDHLLADEAS